MKKNNFKYFGFLLRYSRESLPKTKQTVEEICNKTKESMSGKVSNKIDNVTFGGVIFINNEFKYGNVAESADATDLKSVGSDTVRVRPPLAPQKMSLRRT